MLSHHEKEYHKNIMDRQSEILSAYEVGREMNLTSIVTEFTSSAGDWRRGDPGVGEWKPEEKVICMNERFLRQ